MPAPIPGFCDNCLGMGFVYHMDESTGMMDPEDCYPCKGTGIDGYRKTEEHLDRTVKSIIDE